MCVGNNMLFIGTGGGKIKYVNLSDPNTYSSV